MLCLVLCRVDSLVSQSRGARGRAAPTRRSTVMSTSWRAPRIRATGSGPATTAAAKIGAYGIANRYPVGTEATVYYNPDEPGSSVLEQGADRSRVSLFGGTGALFMLVGLVALAFAAVRAWRA